MDCKENGNDCKEKVTGIKVLDFLQNIFFLQGVYLVTGVVWKSGDRLCGLRGMGASGSHLGTLGGRGVVGCLRAQYLTYTVT